jgi:hypothetical protein
MSWKTTALIVTLAIAPAAAARDVVTPPVPANLEVPAGAEAFLAAQATGTQNYICLPTGTGVSWAFLGPQATLFNADAEQIATHFLSPNPDETGTPRATWQHSRDTSAVWAVGIASSTDSDYVAPGAIPWLLLEVTGAEYGPPFGDKLAGTRFIQRVNTAGGAAPAAGCSSSGDIGRKALVAYTTDYIFYR